MSDMEENVEAPEETTGEATQPAPAASGPSAGSSRVLAVARWRDRVARVVWVICVTFALFLAAAAFTFALEANPDNELVQIVRDLADVFDLGFFDLDNPVKEFAGQNALVKTALFNYGIAAVVYLVIGRLLERIVRP